MEAPPSNLITTAELCDRLGLTRQAVNKLKRRGLTPDGNSGRSDLWNLDRVVAWRAKNSLPSANKSGVARGKTERVVVGDGNRQQAAGSREEAAPPSPSSSASSAALRGETAPSRYIVEGFETPRDLVDADIAIRSERAQYLYLQKLHLAGDLVSSDAVARTVARLVGDAKRILDNLPKRAAPALCSALKLPSSRAAEIEAVLREHVEQVEHALAAEGQEGTREDADQSRVRKNAGQGTRKKPRKKGRS